MLWWVMPALALDAIEPPRERALELFEQALLAEAEGGWTLAVAAAAAGEAPGRRAVQQWSRRWSGPRFVEALGVLRPVTVPHVAEAHAYLRAHPEPAVGTLDLGDLVLAPLDDGDHRFWLSTTEVTVDTWEQLTGVREAGCGACAVRSVSFDDAVRFCNALSVREGLAPVYAAVGDGWAWDRTADGYRLPTREEWTHATWLGRAPRRRAPGGRTPSSPTTPAVAGAANPWGLRGLADGPELVWGAGRRPGHRLAVGGRDDLRTATSLPGWFLRAGLRIARG